jgi:hypothetical protein
MDIATDNPTDRPVRDEMGNVILKENGMLSLNGESIAFESYRARGCIFTGNSSGGRVTRLQVCDSLIWTWTLSPDGRVVVSVTSEPKEKILKFWDTASGKVLYSTYTTCDSFICGDWYRPFESIKSLSFSPDSSWMAFFGPPGVRIGPRGVDSC